MSELIVRLDYVQVAMLLDELRYLADREFHEYNREEVDRERKIIVKIRDMLDKAVEDKKYKTVVNGE